MPARNGEAGYFVVIDADGSEIEESRRFVPEGRDRLGDQQTVDRLRASMGPACEVVFKFGKPVSER